MTKEELETMLRQDWLRPTDAARLLGLSPLRVRQYAD